LLSILFARLVDDPEQIDESLLAGGLVRRPRTQCRKGRVDRVLNFVLIRGRVLEPGFGDIRAPGFRGAAPSKAVPIPSLRLG
jgi:hypothetical protein